MYAVCYLPCKVLTTNFMSLTLAKNHAQVVLSIFPKGEEYSAIILHKVSSKERDPVTIVENIDHGKENLDDRNRHPGRKSSAVPQPAGRRILNSNLMARRVASPSLASTRS